MIFRNLMLYLLLLCFSQLSIATPNQMLPSLGDSASSYVSLQQEHDLGRLWLRQLRAQVDIIENPNAVQFLEALIFKLVPHSEVKINDFEFIIVDQAELNAFAVPGGIIGVNLGLFLYTRDEDEVASVLAHELAHLSQRHFARRIEQAEKQTPLAIASLLASILLIAASQSDAGFAGLIGAQAASIQQQLAYSRDWEREADRIGMKTLANSGMDPNAMSSMFQQMLNASRHQQRPPEFLLTHPVTEGRISDAADRAENYDKQTRTASFEFYLLQHQALLRYRVQGKEQVGYFTELVSKSTHQQQAAAQYTLAELALNNEHPKDALNHWRKIPQTLQTHSASVALKADILQALGESESALTALEKALPFAPQDYVLQSKLAEILQKQNQWEAASKVWRQLSLQRSTEPVIWKHYAQTAHEAQHKSQSLRAQAEYLFLNGQQPQALRQMDLAVKQAKLDGDLKSELAFKQRQHQMADAPNKL